MSTAPEATPKQEFSFIEILYAVWKHRRIPAILAAVGLAFGFVSALRMQKVYQSDALIQIERKDRRSPGGVVTQTSDLLTLANPAEADMGIVKSRLVLGAVVRSRGMNLIIQPERGILDRLLRRPEPRLVGVQFEATSFPGDGEFRIVATERRGELLLTDPDGAEILKVRVGVPVDSSRNRQRISIRILGIENARAGQVFHVRLRNAQEIVNSLGSSLDVQEIGRETGVLLLTMKGPDPYEVSEILNGVANAFIRQDIDRRIKEVRHRVEFLESKLPELRQKVQSSEDSLRAYQLRVGSIDIDQEVGNSLQQQISIHEQILQLLEKRSQSLLQFKPDHPVIRSLDSTLSMLRQRAKSLDEASQVLPQRQLEILRRNREVQVNTERYEEVLREAQQFRVIMDQQMGSARIVDDAVPAQAPQPSKRKLALVLGLFGGLAFGCILAFALQVFSGTIGNPAVIESLLAAPVVALLPRSPLRRLIARAVRRDPERVGKPLALESLSRPTEHTAESLRTLIPRVVEAVGSTPDRTLLLASPVPSATGWMPAADFAILLARSGVRVALVDADMRGGLLAAAFGCRRAPGLAEILLEKSSLEQASNRDLARNLTFIPRGSDHPQAFELSQSPALGRTVEALAANHDVVLLYGPPLLGASDTRFLATAASSALLVVEHDKVTSSDLMRCARLLEESRTKLLGTILDEISGVAPINGMPFRFLQHSYPAGTFE